MANENNAIVNTEPRELNYKAKATVIRDGEREQKAIVNQEEKGNVVNTISVDEVKEIAEKVEPKTSPIIYEIEENDPDDLMPWLNDNAYKLKVGDILYFNSDSCVGIINNKTDRYINFIITHSLTVATYRYRYLTSSNLWRLDYQKEVSIGFNRNELTYSYNDFDDDIKQVLHAAIIDGNTSGVSCTEQEWKELKKVFNEALYFVYSDTYLIKTYFTDHAFNFGYIGTDNGTELFVLYEKDVHLLYALYREF